MNVTKLTVSKQIKPPVSYKPSTTRKTRKSTTAKAITTLSTTNKTSKTNNIRNDKSIAYLSTLTNHTIATQMIEYINKHIQYSLFEPLVRNLCMNLDRSCSTFSQEFHDQLMNGDITPNQAVMMNAFQRNKTAWLIEQTKIDQNNEQAIKNEKFRARSTDYTCPSCHLKDSYYYAQQDRRGDEGMTLHLECVQCGQEWTKNT